MEAVTCSETSAPVYQITEHEISEDGIISVRLEIFLESRNLNNLPKIIGFWDVTSLLPRRRKQ